MKLTSVLTHPFRIIVDFLAPKYCLICEEMLNNDNQVDATNYLCKSCFFSLDYAPKSEQILDRLFENFEPDDIALTKIFSLFKLHQQDFAKVIYNLKYHKLYKVGYEFGLLLGEKVIKETDTNYDYVAAVPVHIAKKRERGYNQSDYIASGVANRLAIPNYSKFLVRSKYTTSQTKLNSQERKKNILGAYKLRTHSSEFLHNKSILIVDDVFTTGSTVNHLANELLNAGAKRVDCATLGLA